MLAGPHDPWGRTWGDDAPWNREEPEPFCAECDDAPEGCPECTDEDGELLRPEVPEFDPRMEEV